MEKINQNTNTSPSKSTLILENRKTLKLDGIKEIIRSNDTEILLKMHDTTLSIVGTNINISKLDITTGIIEADGIFNNIYYGTKPNLFKRIFK